jgi:prefoldin subunit 5
MAETVVGALRYDFVADTSGLKSGIAKAQDAFKKMSSEVKQSASEINGLKNTTNNAVKSLTPEVLKGGKAFDQLADKAAQSAAKISDDFRRASEEIKKAVNSAGGTMPAMGGKTPPTTGGVPKSVPSPRNDNVNFVPALNQWQEWQKQRRLVAEGMSSVGQQAEVMGQKAARATGLARHEMINLGRQINDVAVSLAGGMSPFMVLTQQGSQIADVFTSTRGSIAGFAGQVLSAVGKVVFSLRGMGAGLAAIFTGIEVGASVARSKLADLAEQAKSASVTPEKLLGAQVKGATVGLSNDDVVSGLQNANKAFEDYKRNAGAVVSTVKEIDKSFLKTLDSTTSFSQWLDVVANKIRTLPATQARDLAESIFPADKAAKFIDLINQGKFSMAEFQRAADAAGGGFNNIANSANDLRNRISAADEEVNSRLLVSLSKIATPLGNVTTLWTDIKSLIADTIPYVEKFISVLADVKSRLGEAYSFLKTQISEIVDAIQTDLAGAIATLQGPMSIFTNAWDFVSAKIAKAIEGVKILKGLYDQAARSADNFIAAGASEAFRSKKQTPMLAGGFTPASGKGQMAEFKPSDMFLSTVGTLAGEKTGDTRKSYQTAQDANKAGKADKADRLKEYIENLREANQLAQTEVNTFTLGNVEKEKFSALIKAENIAKEQGKTLTAQQRAEIENITASTQKYKDNLDQLRASQGALNDAMRSFADFTINALDGLVTKSKKLSDVLRDVVRQLSSSALQGALTGQGIFGQMMGLSGKGGQTGGILGMLAKGASSLFAGFFAEGGSIPSGKWGIAGEAGPELVQGPANITPLTGGGQPKITINNYSNSQVDARQMSDGQIIVTVQQMINSGLKRVPNIMAEAQRRSL